MNVVTGHFEAQSAALPPLPRIRAPMREPEANDPAAAKQRIFDAIVGKGSEHTPIIRWDGTEDVIVARIATPPGLDDVMITQSLVDHIIDGKGQHREEFAHYILPSLTNPAEVLLTEVKLNEKRICRQLFLTAFSDLVDTVAVVQEDANGWLTWTFYAADNIDTIRSDDRHTVFYRRSNQKKFAAGIGPEPA